jgi:hypothetical protein
MPVLPLFVCTKGPKATRLRGVDDLLDIDEDGLSSCWRDGGLPLVGVVMMASLLVGDAALAEVGAVSAVPAEILLGRIRRCQSWRIIPPLSLPRG